MVGHALHADDLAKGQARNGEAGERSRHHADTDAGGHQRQHGEHIGRTFYGTTYDEDSPTAPACWSADGVKPDAKIATPQSATCAACPQNIKGSGTLEDTRACRFSQRVAVVLANNIEGDVLALTVPAKSLFGKPDGANLPMQAYGQWHVNVNKSKIEDVVTRLKFDLKAESPKLFFKPMRWLEAEEKEVIAKQAQGEDALKAVTTSFGMSVPAPAVALPPPMEKPKPKIAAPVVEKEPPALAPTVGKKRGRPAKTAEAPAHEPVVRAAAPEPELPKRSTAAQVAANWDTDD